MRPLLALSSPRPSRKHRLAGSGDASSEPSPVHIISAMHCDVSMAPGEEPRARLSESDSRAACYDEVEVRITLPGHWSNLGAALRAVGRYHEARTAFREARKMAPQDIDFALQLACLELECGRHQHALDMFQIVLHMSPRLVRARISAARACHELGKKKRARSLLQDWQHWRLNDDCSAELAALMIQLGDTRTGLSMLDAIHDLSLTSTYARVCLATALERIGCLEKAHACAALLPSPADIRNPLLREEILTVHASLAWRDGDLSTARELLRFLDAPPAPGICRSARPYFLLAEVHYQQSDMEAANAALATACSTRMMAADIAPPAMLEFSLPG